MLDKPGNEEFFHGSCDGRGSVGIAHMCTYIANRKIKPYRIVKVQSGYGPQVGYHQNLIAVLLALGISTTSFFNHLACPSTKA